MYQNVANTYRSANFNTANPLRLVIMCYDGAISSLKLARDSYKAKNYEAKAKALQKAIDIIHEMNVSLDLEKGGTIAKNLRSLYLYMIGILTEADVKKNIHLFDEVIRMLEELESAWKEIARGGIEESRTVTHPIPASERKVASVNQAWSV
jgi:flagellar protein FliS